MYKRQDLTSPEAYDQAGRSEGIMDMVTGNAPWGKIMNDLPQEKRKKILMDLMVSISRG